jgi:arylformamidase
MNITDISWPISNHMTQYKNRKNVSIEYTKSIPQNSVFESKIIIDSHVGTHVDAPSHFLTHANTIDQVDLDTLCGSATVIDFSSVQETITASHFDNKDLGQSEIVLLKTRNSLLDTQAPFNPLFVHLAASGAEFLANKKIKAVGIDYLGIERSDQKHETHTTLFQNSVTIIEGLRLAHVAQGDYIFICLPLLVPGIDAAPARAILIKKT